MRKFIFLLIVLVLTLPIFAQGNFDKSEPVLNVYSSRHYDVDDVVYKMFEDETGIKINVVKGKGPELVQRIIREKGNSQADVFLTVGAESIYPLKSEGLLQNFDSELLNSHIPASFRGDGWTGIMSRARVVAVSKDRVNPSSITSYADLAKDDYKGKILVRSSSSSYNIALLSSFVQLYGKDWAENWAKGVVANMARSPKGNDRDQAKGVAAEVGDVAIMNSYYFVRMSNSSDANEKAAASKVQLVFPKETHLNLSYAALLNGAKNRENAIKFMEFLSGAKIQKLYAQKNGEFPLNRNVALPEIQASWGSFETQDLNFEELGKYSVDAAMIFDKVGWK